MIDDYRTWRRKNEDDLYESFQHQNSIKDFDEYCELKHWDEAQEENLYIGGDKL